MSRRAGGRAGGPRRRVVELVKPRPLIQAIGNRLWIKREEGEVWPRGYGIVSRNCHSDGFARGTIIPLNLLIGWVWYLYWKTRFGWAPPASWHDVRLAYADGRTEAWSEAWGAGYSKGAADGWDSGYELAQKQQPRQSGRACAPRG